MARSLRFYSPNQFKLGTVAPFLILTMKMEIAIINLSMTSSTIEFSQLSHLHKSTLKLGSWLQLNLRYRILYDCYTGCPKENGILDSCCYSRAQSCIVSDPNAFWVLTAISSGHFKSFCIVFLGSVGFLLLFWSQRNL